jgi:hypothetical protein
MRGCARLLERRRWQECRWIYVGEICATGITRSRNLVIVAYAYTGPRTREHLKTARFIAPGAFQRHLHVVLGAFKRIVRNRLESLEIARPEAVCACLGF